MAAAILSSSAANSTEVILEDTPNVGDTTVITTVTTGNPVTTNNLISQDWDDGSWNGTMFPDNSDINESTWLTGKHGKYAETTLDSDDYVTIEELRQGFTSNFGAQIRWWNPVESEVTMTQTISNGVDTTTQSTTFQDTTNHNYQLNPYGNQLVVGADPDMTHGTATYRFDFNIIGNKNYNSGHAGVDVTDPTAIIDYTALSSTTSTNVTYCYEKTPPTCPGQEELEDLQEQLEQFDFAFEIPEDIFVEPPPTVEYTFMPTFEEEIELEEIYEIIPVEEFFFEEDYIEIDYYEKPIMEEFIPVDVIMVEDVEFFDELPPLELMEELPPVEEVYMEEIVMEEMFAEEFTEEMQEEFIEEVFEEVVMETEPEPIEEKPAMEEIKEEPIEEEIVNEEVAEQPSSEEVVTDEPAPTAEIAKQEEAIQEPTKEQPNADVEVDLDIKVAAIEKAIQGKIKNEMQRVSLTLDVINEVVSREMTAKQADISSYFNTNTALFDTRQIPGGDPAFFLQASLASYDKTIYDAQPSIAGTDPVVKHQIKMQEYKKTTSDAYRNLMELLNARNGQ
tara:strand:+ start:2829 stop:4514 length:1686 start_codon:yes stop_codon:yes gene_type:complete